MNIITTASAATAAAVPHATSESHAERAYAILQAARLLLPSLEHRKPVATGAPSSTMTECFGGTDAEGFSIWKDAYEALEVAQVLFIRKYGAAILWRSASPQAALAMMTRIAQLVPTHTRRSDESQAMQQLSTPLPLAFVTARAAAIASPDLVLEPSAGAGLLAVHADMAQASLALNEIAATRGNLLGLLFPRVVISRHDAAHIDDHLDPAIQPSVVLMNPPFTVGAHVDGHVSDAAWRHLSSAFARLRPGGRLVAITGTDLSPENPKWRQSFMRVQKRGHVVFTAAIDGCVYARHGTTAETRLTVIDKVPAADPSQFVASPGKALDVETLLFWIGDLPQAQPPLFRPMAANVKAGKRFLSTIARRFDTLGTITRGQRQTDGAGLFRAEDNLESPYARAALRQFYYLLHQGKIEGCSLATFETVTGLSLTTDDGSLRDELPPITTWLNRLPALRIETQNLLFEVFEQLVAAKIERAIASGSYDRGLKTIAAESIVVTDRRTVYTHPVSGAQSHVLTVARRDRIRPRGLVDALEIADAERKAVLLVNTRSSRTAVQLPTASIMLDDGTVEHRVRLLRPTDELRFGLDALAETHWQPAVREAFAELWEAEIAAVPEFATSTSHIVTGLLLPIWRRLPDDDCRVYRIQTDDRERIIGRHVAPALVATMYCNLGLADVPSLSSDEAWTGLLDGQIGLQLADGLIVRRSRVMNDHRIKLIGFTDATVPRLKALGLIPEIISWKLRLFIPTSTEGPAILAGLFERHALVAVTDRTAATQGRRAS